MSIENEIEEMIDNQIDHSCNYGSINDRYSDVANDLESKIDEAIGGLRNELEKSFSLDLSEVYESEDFKNAVQKVIKSYLKDFFIHLVTEACQKTYYNSESDTQKPSDGLPPTDTILSNCGTD